MKILIFGSSGMLGSTLVEYLNQNKLNIIPLSRKDLDLSFCNFKELQDIIKKNNPDVIINCAGIIKQRKNIKDSEFIHVNSLVPNWINDIAVENNKKFIHTTTDCIYSGLIGNYNEESVCDVSDIYGLSKFLGEPKSSSIIRTSIIGEEKNNYLSLLEWVKSNKNKTINGFVNHYWNGVTCLQLSKIIYKICNENMFWQGVRHIHSNKISKFELLQYINDIYKLNINILEFKDKIHIDRSLTTKYDLNFAIPELYQQIKETRTFHIKLNKGYNI